MNRLTMTDVARLAGVSKATVSRSIHSPHLVRPETLKLIRRIVDRHHYVYDAVAGDFSRKKTSVIGLIVPTIQSSIFAKTTYGIEKKASERGYSLLIGNTHYDPNVEAALIQLFQQRRVAGLILTGVSGGNKVIQHLAKSGTPSVITWEIVSEKNIHCVGFDNFKAAYQATEYLISLGHKRIGLIVGPFSQIDRVKLRFEGYRKALEINGIPYDPSLVVENDYTLLDGKEAMHRLCSLPERPTAIFAASDVLAMGALSAACERGLNVPQDVSIVGFDDIDIAAFCVPPLTTVRVPAYEMGDLAMKILLERIEGGVAGITQYSLETNLIIRASSGEPGISKGKLNRSVTVADPFSASERRAT
jgi:DNA-binding LacI/PurR family transcriptional regulator